MNRNDLLRGHYHRVAQQRGVTGLLDREERDRSRRQFLNSLHANEDLWIFAYGSLVFSPGFEYCERLIGRLYGYHRSFCIWSRFARGTTKRPGLALGLNPGGSCKGIVYRIPPELVDEGSTILWAREMLIDAYQPRWITVVTATQQVRAITFVTDKRSEQFAGNLPEQLQLDIIATTSGYIGSCTDYLRAIISEFVSLGVRSPALERLHRLVELRRG